MKGQDPASPLLQLGLVLLQSPVRKNMKPMMACTMHRATGILWHALGQQSLMQWQAEQKFFKNLGY
jgi:hypothetical protein